MLTRSIPTHYRLNIDNDGDLLTDTALSYVFSKPQTASRLSTCFWPKARSRAQPKLSDEDSRRCRSLIRPQAQPRQGGDYTFFAGSRSDAFFFDFDGIKNLFDHQRKAEFHRASPKRQVTVDWRGFEYRSQRLLDGGRLPTSELARSRSTHLGTMQRAAGWQADPRRSRGHPSVSSFFNTDDTKLEYNASEPVERSQALARSVRASDGPHGKLLARRSDYRDRQGANTADVLSFDPRSLRSIQRPSLTDDVMITASRS